MIRKLSVTASLILGIILSVIFERNVYGRHYATLAFVCALSLYWVIELILDYISFRKAYAKGYQIYKVEMLNSSPVLTMEMIERNNKKYYKRFKKTKMKESALKIALICSVFGIFVAVICGFFL